MKKVFLFAMAALTMLACNKKDETVETTITMSQPSAKIEIGGQVQLSATVNPSATVTWSSDDASIASVNATGLVVGLKQGTTYVRAKANNKEAYCIVTVGEQGGGGGGSGEPGKMVTCVKIWPVVMDATTATAQASKIVADFRPDDVNRHLYVWSQGETYSANANPTGKNFFQTDDGFTAMTVEAPAGWSGMGYFLDSTQLSAFAGLITAIKANPSNFGFHMAFKSTDNAGHYFAILGNDQMKWSVGTYESLTKKYTIPRTGAWGAVNINMSEFAAVIAGMSVPTSGGMNVFYMGSGAVQGTQLNLDACYFYQIAN